MTVPYGDCLRIEQNHRIYTWARIGMMMHGLHWTHTTVDSPEADYKIALIKGVKH